MTQSELSPLLPPNTNPPSSTKRRSLRKPMFVLAATTLMTGAIAIAATPFNAGSQSCQETSKAKNNAPSVANQTVSSEASSMSDHFVNNNANAEAIATPDSASNSRALENQTLGSQTLESRILGIRETTEDGERVRIVAFEPDLDIYLHESTSDGIEVRTRSYLFGTSTDQIAVATNVEELREKYPEAFRLYKSYIDEAHVVPTSRYTLPAEEMPKLAGHGFLNSTLPISTMSLRESPATEKSSKISTKTQKPTSEKPKGKASVKKSDERTGRTPPSNKKVQDISRKSADKKTSSATSSSSKKMPQKSAASVKDRGKGKSASSKTTAKSPSKAKSLPEANSKKMNDKSRKATTSQGDMKDKIASGNSTTGKSNSKVGPKPDSKDDKAKTASQKNSAAKKITDKASLKTKRSKDIKPSSPGSTNASKDQAKSVSFEKDASDASQDATVTTELSGAINGKDSSQKSRKSTQQDEDGNRDSDQVTHGKAKMVPETAPKVMEPVENESLDKESDPSQLDMEMNCPAAIEGTFGEEMQDEYWDARHKPQVKRSFDLASRLNTEDYFGNCLDRKFFELDANC